MAYFKVPVQHLLITAEGKSQKASVRKAGLLNMKQEYYSLSYDILYI